MPPEAPPGTTQKAPSHKAAAVLDSGALTRIFTGFCDALSDHRERLDSLNVYPVPDGDTGTNMALTMKSTVREMRSAADGVESVCRAVAHGALMGARGNSGVIMAQILRGMSGVLRDASSAGQSLGAGVLARALAAASDGAYGAVGNPVEGTILTVIREASEAAQSAAAAGAGLAEVFDAAGERGYDALRRTPEMLDALAAAGVVDAGGAGLMLLLDAGRAEFSGRPMPEPEAPVTLDISALEASSAVPGAAAPAAGAEPSIADLRYEVMYLLDTPDAEIGGFKASWAEIGDSIVVVGGDGVWNCHVHTDDIGAAIEAGIAVGRPHRIRVTDLLEQVAEQDWVRAALGDSQPPAGAGAPARPPSSVEITEPDRCSVVAVGSGDGVEAILLSMGAHRTVAGGQSMNPSTADLLAAVDSLPTGHVVVLPNNSNIVPVAEQLDDETERSVSVVPTASVIEGLASLTAFNPGADSSSNSLAMTEAAGDVVASQVAQAVRDSATPAGPVLAGDWLGIGPEGIAVVAADEVSAATELLSGLADDDIHELLTVITGADASDRAAAEIVDEFQRQHPDIEVDVHRGGQPLYPYYFGLE